MMRRRPTSLAGSRTHARRRPSPRGPTLTWGTRIRWLLVLLVVAAALVWLLWPVVSVLLGAMALAYLLDPVVDRFEARGISRTVAIGILFLGALLAGALGVLLVIPLVAREFSLLTTNLQEWATSASELVGPAVAWAEEQLGFEIQWDIASLAGQVVPAIQKLSPDHQAVIQDVLTRTISSGWGLVLTVFNLVLLPVFLFYLLRDWDKLVARAHHLLPPRHHELAGPMLKQIDMRIAGFVRGQLTVMGIMALLYSLGLLLAGAPLAILIGVLSGLLFIVPYLGTAVGVVLASLLVILVHGLDHHLLLVWAAFAVPQLLESYLITPAIMEDKVGLHPLVVIVALVAGGHLLGLWGMLIAIPITAALSVLMSSLVDSYLQSSFFSYNGVRR